MATDIFVGSVAVGVVPDARGWESELKSQLVPSSDAVGREVGSNISRGIVQGMSDKEPDVAKKGDESGGAFGDAFSKRLKAALDALPKAQLDADPSKADEKVDELRQRIEDLSKKEIGINMTSKEAMAELDKINTELDKVKFKAEDIPLRFNTVEARAQLDALSKDISSKTGGQQGGVIGLLNKIPGVNLGGAGGAAGSIGGTAASGGAEAASSGGSLLANPYVLAGGGALAAASAPFAGQALGGGLVAGLGGALAGLGVMGALYGNLGKTATVSGAQVTAANERVKASQDRVTAAQDSLNKLEDSGKATAAQLAAAHASVQTALASEATSQGALNKLQQEQLAGNLPAQTQKMKTAFTDLSSDAKKSLAEIGASFVPVMANIFTTADKTMKELTPVFAGAERIISGPFQVFVDTILRSFTSPAVAKSIQDVAKAFSSILTAFTPDIPGIFNSFAQAISRVAEAISKNPKAFADFLNFLAQLVIALIDAIAWLTVAANYLEFHFVPAFDRAWRFIDNYFVRPFEIAFNDLKQWLWNDFMLPIYDWFIHTLPSWFFDSWHGIDQYFIRPFEIGFNNMKQWIWNDFLDSMYNWFVNSLPQWFSRSWDNVYNDFIHPFSTGFTDLKNWIWNDFIVFIYDWFVNKVPSYFQTSVRAIGQFWQGIENVVRAPIAWVTDNVIDGLIRVFNNVIGAIGLGKNKIPEIHPFGLAQGGLINVGSGPTADDVLVRVSRGETVVSAADSADLAPVFAAKGIPGYAGGGIIGDIVGGAKSIASTAGHAIGDVGVAVAHGVTGAVAKAVDVTKIVAALMTGNTQALVNAFGALTGMHYPGGLLGEMNQIIASLPRTLANRLVDWIKSNFTAGTGSANAVLAYADTFTGKVPYVWGGDTPAGWDCSGAVSYILNHFNLLKGRMVAAGLQAWAKSSPPTPGAMAFYGNPAHHVGFVQDATHLWSALGTPYGTVISALQMGDNSGYGVPPQGYGALAGGSVHYNPSGGVMQWNTAVLQALALNGLGAFLASQVEYQMQTESGGNPNAVNNWDINAQHGDPSKGLMQVIGSTFAQYHVPGTSSNIFDPLANIAAAINYAKHTYGPTLMSGGMGMGSGHGYDEGGWLPPGSTFAYNGTGRPELVMTAEQVSRAMSDSGSYHAHFDGLTMQTIESHVRSAFQAMSLQQGNLQRQGRRRLCRGGDG